MTDTDTNIQPLTAINTAASLATKSDRQVQAQTALLVAQFAEFADEGGVIRITTAEQYEKSGVLLQMIASHEDYIKDRHREVKKKSNELHKAVCDLENSELKEPGRLKSAILPAREQYRRLDEERQHQEAERIKRELKSAAETSVIEQATELISTGDASDTQQGLQLLSSVAAGDIKPVTQAPTLIVRTPKSAGIPLRKLKRFRVVNLAAVKREYMEPDMQLIQKIVDARGKAAEEIVGGIEFYEKESEAPRR